MQFSEPEILSYFFPRMHNVTAQDLTLKAMYNVKAVLRSFSGGVGPKFCRTNMGLFAMKGIFSKLIYKCNKLMSFLLCCSALVLFLGS